MTSKYEPLAKHLESLCKNEVRLSFDEIEDILGEELPNSARVHHAWWANSRTDDSHTWAHLWLQTGWERTEFSLSQEWVNFRRIAYYEISDEKAMEGYEYDTKIILRTRNASLAKTRKAQDNFTCQACGYHLRVNESYVIEVHHIDPLSASEERETKISKLVSLCPNCHRIAHLRSIPYSVEEIKSILKISNLNASLKT